MSVQQPGDAGADGAEELDVCLACDDSCWWGCTCPCHMGCEEWTDQGRQSPVRAAQVRYTYMLQL